MRLRYRVDSGWPTQLDQKMRKRISALVKDSSAFKIGITNWPERRIRQYEYDFPKWFSEMVVLYETRSRDNAAALEKRLIDYNWDRHELKNEKGGGGGRYGEGWYYLYIVRRRRRRRKHP